MKRRNFLASTMTIPLFGMLKNNEPECSCPLEIIEYLFSSKKTRTIYLMLQMGDHECWNIFDHVTHNEFDNYIEHYVRQFKDYNIGKKHTTHIKNKSDSVHIYICTDSHYLMNCQRYA